jgi:uncharacterized membrane protein YkvI
VSEPGKEGAAGTDRQQGSRWFRVYVVPAAVFQSALIGGGYGSGREVVEFFTLQGVTGGLLGLVVAALTFAVILALTYEFARCFAAYDYRHFFKTLIGPAWVVYEATYLIGITLVLAIIGSVAGDILHDQLGWPGWVSTALILVSVTVMAFYGRELVARIMTGWAVLLSCIFVLFFVLVVARFGPAMREALVTGTVEPGWARKGLQFGLYNVALVPALLFSVRAIATRREALSAALIAAVAAVFPAVLFHLAFAARHAGIAAQPLPTYWMIGLLGAGWFMALYLIGLFGTLVQTGIGLIQGLIERIDGWRIDRQRPPLTRSRHALLALLMITASGLLSAFGVIALVARGYGLLAWVSLAIYQLPLLTIGIARLVRRGR